MEQSEPIWILVGVCALAGLLLQMRVRRFYFIRHGETLLNAEHVRQGFEGSLSEKGRVQASVVGKYLQKKSIDLIIASNYPRARETAEILKKRIHTRVVSSALLAERRNPSEIIGRSTRDPEVMRIVDAIDLSYHKDTYRFSDEENFAELRERAHVCVTLLERQGAPQTVVITHHVFLKMLIAYILYRDHLTACDFTKLSFFNTSDNAGITICEYNPWLHFTKTRGWKVISYNEQPV